MSTSNSSGFRMVFRGPTKNSLSGTCRRPPLPAIVTMASSAIKVGPLSIDGTAVTRFPPSVPRFRVCTAPMVCAAATSAGNIWRISGERMICVWVTRAPMFSPCSVKVMFFRSSAREISTTTSGPCAANLRSAKRSVPPAIILTLAFAACWARSVRASLESLAAKNSNDFIYLFPAPVAIPPSISAGSSARYRRKPVLLTYHFPACLAIGRQTTFVQI